MLKSVVKYLWRPDSALGVHPGVADGRHARQHQRPESTVGGSLGSELQGSLQADILLSALLLLFVAQRTPAPQHHRKSTLPSDHTESA